jgi:hypothetical protein
MIAYHLTIVIGSREQQLVIHADRRAKGSTHTVFYECGSIIAEVPNDIVITEREE